MKKCNRFITCLIALCMMTASLPFTASADRMPATPGKGAYLITTKISEITVTGVEAPVDGAKPVETCQLGGTGYTLKSMSWHDGSLQMNSVSTFQGGKTYRASFYFLPDDGYTFADAGDMTATVNGEPVEVVSVYGESEQRAVTINFTCPESAKTTVSSIAMTLPVPAAEAAVVLPTIETPGVTFYDFYWLDEDWNEYKVGDKFVAGKTYHCQAYLTAEDGYEIPSAEDIPVTFNGAPAAYYSCPVQSSNRYAIADSPEYKVAAASAVNTIKEVNVIIDEPVADAAPKMDAAKTTTEGISVYYVKWFDTDTKKSVSDKFEAGKGYTAHVYFELNKDYIMPKNLDEVSATINGKVATVTEASETDDMWIAAYDFPKLKDAVDSGSGSGSTGSGTGSVKPDESYKFPFTDVAEGAWYRKDVETAHKNGLVNGKSDTMFYPDDNMTYAEAVKLACAMHQLYHDKKVTLTAGSSVWYSTYMSYALEKGIIEIDLTAVADEKITRSDFVKIFYAALPASEYAVINEVANNAIPDVSLIAKSAKEIYAFYRAGILVGSDNEGTFNPESNIVRSEVAAILTRMFDGSARKTITLR
ncbi:MAG: S-layer homology domain-containing protein [Clostridia bacterium]|nr:S-layer homology domain-containing protein [Clostridia bacterium]